MTIAFQGFAIKENLSEAKNDRDILNNLAGAPLGDDIALLFNNYQNVSIINVSESDIQESIIYKAGNRAVFSNKTKITVGDVTYYVKDSNGLDTFSLSTSSTLSDTVANPPVGDYVRSDRITASNITNFSIVRRNSDVNKVDADTQLGYLNRQSSNLLLSSDNAKVTLENIEANVDFYNYRLNYSLKIDKDFLGKKVLKINGPVIIKDPDNINSGGLTNDNPGLFIYNPTTGTGIRAFSSKDNPWRENGTNLEALTTKITVKNLEFSTDQIKLIAKGSSVLAVNVSTTTITQSNFTHKLPVKINNEIYYLCLNLES